MLLLSFLAIVFVTSRKRHCADLVVTSWQAVCKYSNIMGQIFGVCAGKRDSEKDKPHWEIIQRRRHVFEERAETAEMKVAVEKIADTIVASFVTVAYGGALSAALVSGLRNVVVNASWSSDEKQELHWYLLKNDTLVFVTITKSSRSIHKKTAGFGSDIVLIEADTTFSYIKAGNQTAKKQLRAMKKKKAQDVSRYIDDMVMSYKYNAIQDSRE